MVVEDKYSETSDVVSQPVQRAIVAVRLLF